jgi:two-component system, cell cycle sensor histidine kinase and response regulator CckA
VPGLMRRSSTRDLLGDTCAGLAVVGLGAFLVLDLADGSPVADRFGFAAVLLLAIVGASGFAARRSARRNLRETREAQEGIAEFGRRRESFLDLSDRALHAASLDELFECAAVLLTHHIGAASHAAVFELRPDHGDLRLRAGSGWPDEAIGSAVIGAGRESYADAVLNSFHPIDAQLGLERLFANPPLLRGEGIVRGAAMAIHENGRPFGLIGVYAKDDAAFPPADLIFLQLIANLLTTALYRRGAEDSLQRSEERLRLALELTQIGTWDDDLVAGTAVWSKSLYELMGVDPSSKPGYETFVALLHPDDQEGVIRVIADALTRGGEYEIEDARICRPDGQTRHLFARGRIFCDAEGDPTRMLGVALDITERHRAGLERAELEAQLRQAQKMEAVGQLAGGIAHDFNNLLLALRGYGELALRALSRGDDAREEVDEMLAAAERAAGLTRQLLAFSRRQILQPQVVDLNEVISDIESLLGRLIGEDVVVELVESAAPVWVFADHGQLEQVIANLAVNARDAMPDGGRLTIEISVADVGERHRLPLEPGRYAVLAVSDTGVGMDAETAAQVFEPFFTTKEGIGTGLGLSTVHGIVKQSGGHIWVYSEPGGGATFKIYLPLHEAVVERQELEPAPAPQGRGETVLLVDDDAEVRMFVREMLVDSGYRVLVAGRGEEAIELARSHDDIDIVLTDVIMPGLSGRETVERLRETHPDVGVLYMSGYTDDAVLRRGVLEQGTAFLQKPFGSADLARKVRQLQELR